MVERCLPWAPFVSQFIQVCSKIEQSTRAFENESGRPQRSIETPTCQKSADLLNQRARSKAL